MLDDEAVAIKDAGILIKNEKARRDLLHGSQGVGVVEHGGHVWDQIVLYADGAVGYVRR